MVASMFPGTYPYQAVADTGVNWDGTVTIKAGICLRFKLSCGADRRCGDDVECTTDPDGFNTCATAAFSNLASRTGGSWFRAPNAREMPAAILSAIDEAVDTGGASFDLMFIIDNTGSMSDDISAVKRQASQIIDRIRHLGDATVRVGLALYSDLCVDPSGWLKFQDLTTNLDLIQRQILAIGVAGGGDTPESVYDALDTVLRAASWSHPARYGLLIGDAPPHERGDTCYRKTLEDAVAAASSTGVQVNLFPIVAGFR